ncbi:MAG: ABC transporter ATP-binding protein, partial [Clostridia bacterium]|nr:ABC transporter ATP-binding protein [Clostridia bacterium]
MSVYKYLKKYWFWAVLSPLAMMLEVMCDLQLPSIMQRIVDDGINNLSLTADQKVETVLSLGLLMLLLGLLSASGGTSSSFFAAKASQGFGKDLRKAVFSRVMYLSFEQTDRFTTGSLVTRLSNDINMTCEFVTMVLRMFIRTPFMLVGGLYMLISLAPEFGLALLVSFPIILVFFIIFLKKATPLFTLVQKKLDNVNGVVQENVTGARVVKAYVREDHETERFRNANYELAETTYRVMRLLSIIMPMIMIVMNLTVVAVIVIGGFEIDGGVIKVGGIMAAITYLTMVLNSFFMVGMMSQSITRAAASTRRIKEVLST